MELIFVRHGESEGNVLGHVYGHTDYPLTKKGRRQIPHINETLKHYNITKIYSSPLVRASAIGEGISEAFDLELIKDDRLKEINFGVYEDLTREEVMEELGERYYELIGFFDHFDTRGGEHQDDFLDRVQNFIDELLQKEDGCYLITAHFGVIKAALNHLMGYTKKDLRTMAIKPGAVIKLTIKKDRVRLDELIQTYDRVK